MTNQEILISYINKLTEDEISSLLEAASLMLETKELAVKPPSPYCGYGKVIRYGHACQKQRFLCKICGHTFVPTTNTVMAYSHFPASVWKEMSKDTLHGNAIDFSAKRLGIFHQAAFEILLALQELPEVTDACLGEVSEFDETFVLDCYKGRKLDSTVARTARKHGAKAQKRGISNEYICICTGIQRKGEAIAATVNRAKPSAAELIVYLTGISQAERSPFATG